MAETGIPTTNDAAETLLSASPSGGGARSKDEVALDLMKFVALVTGYGRASQGSTGFSGKPSTKSAEEHAEALLDLFQRCRRAVNQET